MNNTHYCDEQCETGLTAKSALCPAIARLLLIRQLKELTASERDGRRPVHLIRPRRGAALPKRQPHLLPKQFQILTKRESIKRVRGLPPRKISTPFLKLKKRRAGIHDFQPPKIVVQALHQILPVLQLVPGRHRACKPFTRRHLGF